MWGVNHPTLLETQNFMTPCYFGAPKKEISDQVRKSPLYIVHSHSSRPVRPQTIQTAAVIENDPQDQPLCRLSFTYDLNNTQANMAGC